MNNTYFNKDIFPQSNYNDGIASSPVSYNISTLPLEQSYIENILRFNKGKQVCVYMTFPYSNELGICKFCGIIEQSGKDFIILSEPSTGKWQLLPIVYVDYITFDESINYSMDFYPNNWFFYYNLLQLL